MAHPPSSIDGLTNTEFSFKFSAILLPDSK